MPHVDRGSQQRGKESAALQAEAVAKAGRWTAAQATRLGMTPKEILEAVCRGWLPPEEGCVWMAEIMGNWPSGHGQITKIWLSDRCGGKTIPAAMQFGYNLREFGGYLGNVG